MSIAYQSWEIGSGPIVGYKAQAHPSSGDGLNFRKLHYTPAKFMQQPLPLAPPPPPQASPSQRFSAASASVSAAAASTSGCGGGGAAATKPDAKVEPCVSSSSSLVTSSISNDSSDESEEKEVESAFKGPLEQMESLMTTLPMRRGLSKFFVGKSRSFTSLADVKSMCMKDLVKPDNPYAKKRRPSHRDGVGGADSSKPKFPPPRMTTSGISKKPISSNGTTLTLAVAMSTTTNQGRGLDGRGDESSAPAKRWQKSCRSFSLTDLQKA